MSLVGNPRYGARKRVTPATRRRALELLASCRGGCTEAMMLAHGFTIAQVVELVNAGLGTAKAERVATGGKSTEIARVRITDAGLKALIQWHHQARSAPRARGRAFGR
jgi:hypothetical protein